MRVLESRNGLFFDGIKVNTFISITKGGKFPRNCQFALINLLFDFRYLPYNPDPAQLKKKTDRALELLKQITSIKIDENKMKPREVKALAQVLGVFYELAERLKIVCPYFMSNCSPLPCLIQSSMSF